MITKIITDFPPAPQSTDAPIDFNNKADVFIAHQAGTYVPEVNAWALEANALGGELNASTATATSAANSATDSETKVASSATSAASSANFKGEWYMPTTYNVPSSVIFNGVYYNAIRPTTGDTPDTSPLDWVEQALDLMPVMAVGNINDTLLDLPLHNSLDLKNGVGSVTFARASVATYVDRYGVLQNAAIDEARFEKDGLLIEGESTNLCLNSDVLSTQSIAVTSGETYTISFFDGDGSIVLSDGGSGTIDKDNNITFTASTDSVTLTVTGVVNKAQIEAMPFASSYIPTTDAAVTRAAESCELSLENLPSVVDDFTIAADTTLNRVLTTTHTPIITFDGTDADNKDRFMMFRSYNTGLNTVYPFVLPSMNNGTIDNTIAGYQRTVVTKNDTRISLNTDGIYATGRDVDASKILNGATYLNIGHWGTSTWLNGHIKNVRFWNRALTAEEVKLA